MVTEELRQYIRESFSTGKSAGEIQKDLLVAGWQEGDVKQALQEFESAKQSPNVEPHVAGSATKLLAYLGLAGVVVFGGTTLYLWQDRLDLADTNAKKVQEFYAQLAQSQVAFTDAGEMVFPDEQKFLTQKAAYIEEKKSFIEADLQTMKLTLYESGEQKTVLEILTKGREKGWWETPTGNYKVLGKAVNGYSSIGEVWMPYSVQFYGNYLLHGWPHYDDGTPVPQGYSGGCIRLSNEDAKKMYEFVQIGMPVLVLEAHEEHAFGALAPKAIEAPLPAIGAKSFLIADLASGETIVEKRADEKLPVASLTKLMTAVVAHEVIYLGRSIRVTPGMLASVAQIFHPAVGERYVGVDLLYPLLMQSSNDSANVLAGFLGDTTFVRNMNTKASSLGMVDTQFADPSGISDQNISTTNDLVKLLQYIYYKRPFLFDISKGIAFENVGLLKIGDTIPVADLKNVNEFISDPDLIGIKNGQTAAARQTMASVWNLHTEKGDVPVAIIVLGSEDRKADTEALLRWLKANFALSN